MAVSGVGGNTAAAAQTVGQKKPAQDAVAEFLTYMQMSPAERIVDAWLRQHNLTREKLAAMSPEERNKIMRQMQQDIEQQIKHKSEQDMQNRLFGGGKP